MKDLTDEDARDIRNRMAEIARSETPLVSRISQLSSADLDQLGYYNNMPRGPGEDDYAYRARLKTNLCAGT